MYAERHTVELTTVDGGATGYTPVVTGRVLGVIYTKTDFANGVDVDVTAEATGQTIWDEDNVDASATVYPRRQVHSTAGVALTLEGTEPVVEPVVVVHERIKVVVANAGDGKTGSFTVIIG